MLGWSMKGVRQCCKRVGNRVNDIWLGMQGGYVHCVWNYLLQDLQSDCAGQSIIIAENNYAIECYEHNLKSAIVLVSFRSICMSCIQLLFWLQRVVYTPVYQGIPRKVTSGRV